MNDDSRPPSSAPAGAVLAVFGAVLLLASLFLTWYDPDLSGWTAFEVLDLVLAGCAVFAFTEALRDLGAGLPGPDSTVGAWLPGALGVVIVLTQLVNEPPAAIGATAGPGLWLALAASLLLLLAGLAGRVQVTFVGHGAGYDTAPPSPAPAAPAGREPSTPAPFVPPARNPYEPAPPGSEARTEPLPGDAPAPPPAANLWGPGDPPPAPRTDPPTQERSG